MEFVQLFIEITVYLVSGVDSIQVTQLTQSIVSQSIKILHIYQVVVSNLILISAARINKHKILFGTRYTHRDRTSPSVTVFNFCGNTSCHHASHRKTSKPPKHRGRNSVSNSPLLHRGKLCCWRV